MISLGFASHQPSDGRRLRRPIGVIAVVGLLASCTSGGGARPDPTIESATEPTTFVDPGTATATTEPMSAATTAAPTTTLAPTLTATIEPLGELESLRQQGERSFANGAAPAGDLGLVVGSHRESTGEAERAAVWWITTDYPRLVMLDSDSDSSGAVDAVDTGDGGALVVGHVRDRDGRSRPAAWPVTTGDVVEAVALPDLGEGGISHVARTDAGYVLLGFRTGEPGEVPWVGRLDADGSLQATDLPVPAERPAVARSLLAQGSSIQVFGEYGGAGASPMLRWWSTDGGVSFDGPTVAGDGEFVVVSGAASDGSTLWATACNDSTTGPVVLWSDDGGATFASVALDIEGLWGPYGGDGCPSAPVVEDGRVHVGVVVWGVPTVAVVDRSGIVSTQPMVQRRTSTVANPPTVVSAKDRVFVAAEFTGFDVQVGDLGPLGPAARPIVAQFEVEPESAGRVMKAWLWPVFEGFNDIGTSATVTARLEFFERGGQGLWTGIEFDDPRSVTVGPDGAAIAVLEAPVDEPRGVWLAVRPSATEPFGAPFEVPLDPVPDLVSVVPVPAGWMMLSRQAEWFDDAGRVLDEPIVVTSATVSGDGISWSPASMDPSPGPAATTCFLPSGDPLIVPWAADFRGTGEPVVFRDQRFSPVVGTESIDDLDCSSTADGVVVFGETDGVLRAWSIDESSLGLEEFVLPDGLDTSLVFAGVVDGRATVVLAPRSGRTVQVFADVDGEWLDIELDPAVISPFATTRSVFFDGESFVVTQAVDGVVESFLVRVEVG